MSTRQDKRPRQASVIGRRAFILTTVVAVACTAGLIALSRATASEGSFEVVGPPSPTPSASVSSASSPLPISTEVPTAAELGAGQSLGSADAPVTVSEFAEFQCHICSQFFADNEKELREKYIDTGKVRFVFKHFPMFGKESLEASLASEAAGRQGKFWEYHDLLMEYGASPSEVDMPMSKLQSFAEKLGLDMVQFDADMQSQELRQKIAQDFAQGRAMGVTGTPTFFVHGGAGEGVTRKGEGDIAFEKFKELVDSLLAESQGQ